MAKSQTPPISVRLGEDLREFLENERGENESVGHFMKCLMVIAANALYDADLAPPRKPGGLMVDLSDPAVMERLRERAAQMRSMIGQGNSSERS